MTRRLAWLLLLLPGCADEESAGHQPPGPGSGQPSSGGIGESSDGGAGTGGGGTSGASGGTGSTGASECSPYGDPAIECGVGLECSVVDETCQPSSGMAAVGQECTTLDATLLLDTCLPELLCVFSGLDSGRCMAMCDPSSRQCDMGESCVELSGTGIVGVCFAPCSMLQQSCPSDLDGCYPVQEAGGDQVTGCMPGGEEAINGPCLTSTDCFPGLICTPETEHTGGCPTGDASCCSPVCDATLGGCAMGEPVCKSLGNSSEPDAGVCGPEG